MNEQDTHAITIENKGNNIFIVRPTVQQLDSSADVDEIATGITNFIAQPSNDPRHLILDLKDVSSMSSLMLGKLQSLQTLAKGNATSLILAGANDTIMYMLGTTQLGKVFDCREQPADQVADDLSRPHVRIGGANFSGGNTAKTTIVD